MAVLLEYYGLPYLRRILHMEPRLQTLAPPPCAYVHQRQIRDPAVNVYQQRTAFLLPCSVHIIPRSSTEYNFPRRIRSSPVLVLCYMLMIPRFRSLMHPLVVSPIRPQMSSGPRPICVHPSGRGPRMRSASCIDCRDCRSPSNTPGNP